MQAIKFQMSVATKALFEDMIAKAPLVLHISCHGIQNTPRTMRANWQSVKDEGDFLLFETNEGAGELVSCKKLKDLIIKSK